MTRACTDEHATNMPGNPAAHRLKHLLAKKLMPLDLIFKTTEWDFVVFGNNYIVSIILSGEIPDTYTNFIISTVN